MELSDVLRAPAKCRMSAKGAGATGQARPIWSAATWVAALSIAAALPLLTPGNVTAQQGTTQRPGITQLTAPEPDADTTRREAADERVAAFLIAEARELSLIHI